MAQSNLLKRYLDAGMAFTAITQAKAEEIVKDLVTTGEVQTEQAQAAVNELLERSRKNTEAFIEQVREEIATSAESLGLATVADIARIEKRIDTIRPGGPRTTSASKRSTAKKSTAKKSPAKKSPAKKRAAKKAPAKRSTAKRSAAKKSPAKKRAAKKAPAKKTAAKKAPAKRSAAKKSPAKKAAARKTSS